MQLSSALCNGRLRIAENRNFSIFLQCNCPLNAKPESAPHLNDPLRGRQSVMYLQPLNVLRYWYLKMAAAL